MVRTAEIQGEVTMSIRFETAQRMLVSFAAAMMVAGLMVSAAVPVMPIA